MSYSNGGGGTLTLPSPTHVHHVDVTSAVRSLRRSISRSPSKFRLVNHRSESTSPNSPLSPSPISQQPRALSQGPTYISHTPTHTPSPLARPFPPSVKLSLRSASRSKAFTSRASSNSRTSPNSPMKRALSQSSDSGNSTPASQTDSSSDQENQKSGSGSPTVRRSLEKQNRERVMPFTVEIAAPINLALSRLGDGSSDFAGAAVTTSSPLKRSDAIMNLDQASLGSPVAKRRSLHGSGGFGHDFNVFDHGPTSSPHFEIHDDSSQEHEMSSTSLGSADHPLSTVNTLPRRSSSLRKSTLQQRHGEKKTSWGRKHAAHEMASSTQDFSTPVTSKTRPRLSLDQFLPPMSRDSPFTSQGSLPNASMHVFNSTYQPAHQPHPLSRTMTTSSSNSSLLDESPTHIPLNFGEQPRPKLDFSKSLPAGTLRPLALDNLTRDEYGGGSFATPDNYRSVKPLPAAFMSTGLISKVNRNAEVPQIPRGGTAGNMPDTPCKKPINGFATMPVPVAGSALAKARHIRHSFGTPSTPFNPHGTQQNHSAFGVGAGVFGSAFRNRGLVRRESFLSIDGEDQNQSREITGDSQNTIEYEFPPTPTKQTTDHTAHNGDESPLSVRAFPASAVGHGPSHKPTRTSSKLNILLSPDGKAAEDSDTSMDLNDSPTTSSFRLSSNSSISMPSFSRSRALRGSTVYSPAPLIAKSLTTSILSPSRIASNAKFSHVTPASPLERLDFIERLSPHTPQETMPPPDQSNLSISHQRDGQLSKHGVRSGGSMAPPATPTTGRDYFALFGDRRTSITPITTFSTLELDLSLTSRFEKVELIGTGEFSQVYRVTQSTVEIQPIYFGASGSPFNGRSSLAPMQDRVFAVKKSRQPFQGTRDRIRKLQEVYVLRALVQSDHVVHLIDSWEQNDYLYIQTEFCEEGSLDLFLSQVGRKGRLDDFRIWKIMLELCGGLKHIHDSGFIHLDLKPANIFITFEGVLKIGDFGMATAWPAQPGIEGEGDREYIGPEILLGHYDKPADVFALGLIMLEIAGNVQLPDNGPTWQRLRSGDMSDVPSLTWSSASTIMRDATGIPMDESDASVDSICSDDEIDCDYESPIMASRNKNSKSSVSTLSHDAGNLFGSMRRGELSNAPNFMRDQYHEHALDRVVKWMIAPRPHDRPTIHQILESEGLRWVDARRRAGATVFEGNWGPADDVLADDGEMMDV